MTHLTYEIVNYGDGWAYKTGETFSETFPNLNAARTSARKAAAVEYQKLGRTVRITFEDSSGHWHEELSDGNDRPVTSVEE